MQPIVELNLNVRQTESPTFDQSWKGVVFSHFATSTLNHGLHSLAISFVKQLL